VLTPGRSVPILGAMGLDLFAGRQESIRSIEQVCKVGTRKML